MGHTSSSKGTKESSHQLIDVALDAIAFEIANGRPPTVRLEDYPDDWREPAATFVTVRRDGQLLGCIGTLAPREPLVQSIVHNACAAAFRDPRDLGAPPRHTRDLDVHISILGPITPIDFSSEKELLGQIRPGVDGLLLEDGYARGTFLPSVWEQIPAKEDFIAHLKMKAGLPADYWSETLRVSRYTAESIPSDEEP